MREVTSPGRAWAALWPWCADCCHIRLDPEADGINQLCAEDHHVRLKGGIRFATPRISDRASVTGGGEHKSAGVGQAGERTVFLPGPKRHPGAESERVLDGPQRGRAYLRFLKVAQDSAPVDTGASTTAPPKTRPGTRGAWHAQPVSASVSLPARVRLASAPMNRARLTPHLLPQSRRRKTIIGPRPSTASGRRRQLPPREGQRPGPLRRRARRWCH